MRASATNSLGQLVGWPVVGWSVPPRPAREPLDGRWCRLVPWSARQHATELQSALAEDVEGRMWTYLPYGPFPNSDAWRAWAEGMDSGVDPLFYAIVDPASGRAVGVASYLRIDPEAGSIEVGHLIFSPRLQRTVAATEAMYLMMARAFGLGYRRYEWKCDALNAPSRAAALRLGFSFEGIFRQARVVRGRNRDTAWYSVIDAEWPARRAAFERWLAPQNFDADGRQRQRLGDFQAS